MFNFQPESERTHQRLTFDLAPKRSFIDKICNAKQEKGSFIENRGTQLPGRQRLSIQKVPASQMSQRSLMSNSRNRGPSLQSKASYQLLQKQIMVEQQYINQHASKQQIDQRMRKNGSNSSNPFQSNSREPQSRVLSPSRKPKSKSPLPDRDSPTDHTEYFIQVEESYFENEKFPSMTCMEKVGGSKTPIRSREHPQQRLNQLQLSEHANRRHPYQSSLLSQNMTVNRMRADGSLDNITETANDKSAGSVHRMITREEHSETAWSATNMSEPNHEIPSEIGAAICSKKDSKIDRGVQLMKSNVRHNQDEEAISSLQDLVSQKNLISFISFGDAIKVEAISENSSDALALKVQKPIVPKQEYIPKESDKEIKMRPKTVELNEQPVNANLGWFQSLSLSVSQLIFSAPAPAAIQDPNAKRRISNGEVPEDEEEDKNADVRDEQTRMHEGNTVRKKILFMESGVTSKVKSARHKEELAPLQVSLLSAQSYNQIESGSDPEEDVRSSEVERKNAISFTTSKPQTPIKVEMNKIKLGKNSVRQHSSSFTEQIGSIGASFQNLTSTLLQNKLAANIGRGVTEMVKTPNPKGQLMLEQNTTPVETTDGNRFGMFSRLFDRVTMTHQKEKSSIQDNIMANYDKKQEDEDLVTALIKEKSDLFIGKSDAKDACLLPSDESNQNARRLFGRPPSKTVHHGEATRPLFSKVLNGSHPQPEEKLRQIDKIVFNQDKSHFAVVWTDGGFTKFDVATIQVIQSVFRAPPAEKIPTNAQDDLEITLVASNPDKVRSLGNMQISNKVFRKSVNDGEVFDEDHQNFNEESESENSEKDQFICVALQHRTLDYVATLVRNPKMIIFVHLQEDASSRKQLRKKPKIRASQLGQRTHVKHFSEEVSQIEILPGARYTVIGLKSAIYIYSKNSRNLYDIVPCSSPIISSAIYKSFEDKLVLAYLSKDDPGETILVHDYSVSSKNGMDTIYTIAKPFSSGYKIGGIQLDELGQRICVVSADGRFVYLYCLQEQKENIQVSQDQATPEDGVGTYSDHLSQDLHQGMQHNEVIVKSPQQQFARSSSTCTQIYMPIQIIEGFSMQEHQADFIMLSSSSMTTHIFILKNEEELAESQSLLKESWTFSQFLPQYYSLERSQIRLNIQEELTPISPFHPTKTGAQKFSVAPPEIEGQNVYRKSLQEYPYTCFVESSGLLVVISFSGYCCKFSIELSQELPQSDLRYSGFNSVQASRLSPTRQNNVLVNHKNLSQSLSQLNDAGLSTNERNQRLKTKPRLDFELDSSKMMSLEIPASSKALVSTQNKPKKATAFSGYKQPTLRLKFKIKDFFIKIDQKAESLLRIHKRELLAKRTAEFRERAFFFAQMQNEQRLLEKKNSREDKVSQLKRLLLTTNKR